MKKLLIGLFSVVVIAAGAGYLFREPLWVAVQEAMTEDMFVAADSDDFDVGSEIGQTFPSVKAMYRGQVLTDISQFIGDKGMVFIANRSASW